MRLACAALLLLLPLPAQAGELVVFAAASLKAPFEKLARRFEAGHPGTRVALQLAGSQELRRQIEHGAPVDVFASADAESTARLAQAGLVSTPQPFARNALALAVPEKNPAKIAALADLPRARRIAIAAKDVPVGGYTRAMLDRASGALGADFRRRVEEKVATNDLNVRQVLARVLLGEVDAGVVYESDVAFEPKVRRVAIPEALNVVATYTVATSKRAQPEAAAFVALLLAADGQKALAEAGLRPR